MDIYIAVCVDRHCDPIVEPFDTKEKAIDFAKKFAKGRAACERYIREQENEIEGWIYFCNYSCENDYVFVVSKALNGAI